MTVTATAPPITVFVSIGDPTSAALLKYLSDRGVEHTVLDVADPEVSSFLMQSLGRVTAPITQIGDKMLLGFDPLAIAKYLPPLVSETPDGVAFGAAVRTVTPAIATAAGLAAAFGVEVGPVKADSPAEVAGIQSGDVISEIGAYTITGGREQFVTAVSARRPGDTMALTVWRGGEARPVSVEFPVALTGAEAAAGSAPIDDMGDA